MLKQTKIKNMICLFRKKRHPLSTIIGAFALVAFWRGAWGMMDLFLFPSSPVISYTLSAAIGLLLIYLNDFSLSELEHH